LTDPSLARPFGLLTAALLLAVLAWGCSSGEPGIEDQAGLLTPDQRERISTLHRALLADQDIDFFLVISRDALPDIDRDAAALFARYKVARNNSGRGVLLLVDPREKQVRAEIGYELESVFPDSFVGYIQRRQMLPYFNSGHIGQGIEAAVELFVARAAHTSGHPFEAPGTDGDNHGKYLSGGAGAGTAYGTAEQEPGKPQDLPQVTPQPTPKLALAAYKKILADHNTRPDLQIYSPGSRVFFSKWTMTDAQFDHLLAALGSAVPEKIVIQDNRAVIRYPVADRELSPFLLIHGTEGWMFDFAAMNRLIGINHNNQWHFRSLDHPYMFGFADLRFDGNGFPFAANDH
jgi:hypothetical protein